MRDALVIQNLTKKYDGFFLDHINITLPSGCIMGFIGENGAGKSTTIKLILDLIKKDGGKISVLGTDWESGGKSLRENIGVVMDECSFPELLTVEEVNKVMKHCYRTWKEKTFRSYAEQFSLPLKKPVKEFSRGMKMKLSIAVALSHESKLLIMDEATSGLDPVVRDEILDVFLEFIQDEGHSIFLSSHIISDLEKICDYITLIHKGKILFSQPKDALLDRYVVVKCSQREFDALDQGAVVGVRKNGFGVEALAEKAKIGRNVAADRASIEEIMLYFIKEGNR